MAKLQLQAHTVYSEVTVAYSILMRQGNSNSNSNVVEFQKLYAFQYAGKCTGTGNLYFDFSDCMLDTCVW